MEREPQAWRVEDGPVPDHRERIGLRLEPLGFLVVPQMRVRQRAHVERTRAQHTRRRRAFRDARFDEPLELDYLHQASEQLLEQEEKCRAVQAVMRGKWGK